MELGRRIYRGSRELGRARGCRLKQPHRLVDEYFTEYLFLPMVYNIMEVSSYCFLYIKLHMFSPTLSNFSSAKLHPKCRDAVIYRVAFRAKAPVCRGLDLRCTRYCTPLVTSRHAFHLDPQIIHKYQASYRLIFSTNTKRNSCQESQSSCIVYGWFNTE